MALEVDNSRLRYKLLLRVHNAEKLQHSSSQGAYCKLYLRSTPMTEGSHKGFKIDASDSLTSSDDGEEAWHLEVRRTRTQHQHAHAQETIWDETFEVPIHPSVDVATQILSIRVKSQHRLYCPVIGTCAISLANLLEEKRFKQWFPLQKGERAAGRIRVTLLITLADKPALPPVPRRRQPNQDVVAARSAIYAADEAIERLVEKQGRQKGERPRPERHGIGRNGDQVITASSASWPPPVGVSSPKVLPPLGIPAAFREHALVHEQATSVPIEQLQVARMAECEQRLDRKLQQVRKETARLRKLKLQLKKYIPELQMDTDSEDSVNSDEETERLPFESFATPVLSHLDQHCCRALSNESHRQNYDQYKHSKTTTIAR